MKATFLLHLATTPAGHSPDLDLEVDPQVAEAEIANAAPLALVPPALDAPAGSAGRLFDRRLRVSTCACGSPEDPHDGRARTESWEAIRIPQPAGSSRCLHTRMMPNSGAASPGFPAAPRAAFRTASPLISPTHFHEEPRKDFVEAGGLMSYGTDVNAL